MKTMKFTFGIVTNINVGGYIGYTCDKCNDIINEFKSQEAEECQDNFL